MNEQDHHRKREDKWQETSVYHRLAYSTPMRERRKSRRDPASHENCGLATGAMGEVDGGVFGASGENSPRREERNDGDFAVSARLR